jgi:hypothetical protein
MRSDMLEALWLVQANMIWQVYCKWRPLPFRKYMAIVMPISAILLPPSCCWLRQIAAGLRQRSDSWFAVPRDSLPNSTLCQLWEFSLLTSPHLLVIYWYELQVKRVNTLATVNQLCPVPWEIVGDVSRAQSVLLDVLPLLAFSLMNSIPIPLSKLPGYSRASMAFFT